MRTLLFTAVIALASIGCDKSKAKDDKSSVEHDLPEMTVDQVAVAIEAKQVTLVDCNNEKTRKDHGVIAGAILVEDSETYPASALPADKATKLLFYCGGHG